MMKVKERTAISLADTVLESLHDGVLVLDKEGYIVQSNRRASDLTGFRRSELQGKPLYFLYGEAEESIKSSYELGVAGKKGFFRGEGWRRRNNNRLFWCEISITAIFSNGELQGYSCLLRDNQEQKLNELAMRQSEQRYRVMVEGVRDYCIFMLDATGHILTWNEGATAIMGYRPNEIIGRHISDFYTAEDKKSGKSEHELKVAMETGRFEEEGWRIKKNGSMIWTSVVLSTLYNDENKLIGFSKVTRDLTDRRQKEEDLRQSEERYRSLVEQVIDYGIFMMDEKGRIVSWNEGARRIKGYNADEIIGKYFSIFYPEEDIINGKPGYELRVATAEGKYEEEGWRLRKDGSRFWANVVITAVYNQKSELIGFSKVTRDLTERKESERALRESSERFRQLAEQLRLANAELSFTNQELEQFTSIVSHDLQEPVRTIKSFLHLIQTRMKNELPDEATTYIQKCTFAANRMQQLIRNLLNYSQLSKSDLVEVEVDVEGVINETIANLRSAIVKKNAEISLDLQIEQVKGDRVQLIQLLQNILGNALKFSDKARPKILITSRKSGDMAKLSVQDNGIGIAAEDKNKIFDIFRRLDTTKEYPGTGIGLAICKKIVDRHGGKIWLDSEPGVGTIFHFTIKLA